MTRLHPIGETDVATTTSVLRRYVGGAWPSILAKGLVGARTLVRQTRWARARGEEADFIRRTALAPAIYLQLKSRLGPEKALEAMGEILTTIGVREVSRTLKTVPDGPADPMDRLHAFYEKANREAPNKFIPRTTIEKTADRYHFRITRCIFHEFFTAVGTPELTQLVCAIDEAFFPAEFRELTFHRDGSLDHTIGRGNRTCEFVYDRTSVSR